MDDPVPEQLPAFTDEGVAAELVRGWARFCDDSLVGAGRSRGDWRREQIIAWGKDGSRAAKDDLIRVVLADANENNRESAIAGLGQHGGEDALLILESIYHGEEPARFGRGAAKNALIELGYWRDDAPLLNPLHLNDTVVQLASTVDGGRELERGDPQTVRVLNVGMVDQIPWTPADAARIYLTTLDSFSLPHALQRAEKLGLSTRTFGEDVLAVEGDTWPGFGVHGNRPYLSFIFCIKPGNDRAELLVIAYQLPESTGVYDWTGAARLMVRMSRFLGGVSVAEREQEPPAEPAATADDQLGLLDFAAEVTDELPRAQ